MRTRTGIDIQAERRRLDAAKTVAQSGAFAAELVYRVPVRHWQWIESFARHSAKIGSKNAVAAVAVELGLSRNQAVRIINKLMRWDLIRRTSSHGPLLLVVEISKIKPDSSLTHMCVPTLPNMIKPSLYFEEGCL